MSTPRLYFATRTDLSEGRRAAQLIHAMDQWSARFGPQLGTVIIYGLPNEEQLLAAYAALGEGKTAIFREPDLDFQATAFATDQGPLDLPLLGRKQKRQSYELRMEVA